MFLPVISYEITGNVLNLVLFWQKNQKTPVNAGVFGLCVVGLFHMKYCVSV